MPSMQTRDVLILHGWNLTGKRFDPLARLLTAKGYRVHAPDFPGFGSEPAPLEPWHIADYAEFLNGYVTKRRIANPVIIGHSFGGRVALAYASEHQDRVKSVILTGTPGFSPVPRRKMVFFLLIAKAGGAVFALPVLRSFSDMARKVLYRIAGAREFYRAEGPMRQTFKYIVQDDLSGFMKNLRIPVLLVWGSDDTIVPVSVAERMKETIPGAELKVIPGTGHAVPFADPGAFMKELKGFV